MSWEKIDSLTGRSVPNMPSSPVTMVGAGWCWNGRKKEAVSPASHASYHLSLRGGSIPYSLPILPY